MKLRNNIIYIIGVAAFLLTGCTNLDEDPRSSIDSDNFYKTELDAKAAVNGVYSALISGTSDQQILYNRGIQIATEIMTDDYLAGPAAYNPNVQAISNLTHDASNDRFQSIWQDSYVLINDANVAIDKISAMSDEQISAAKKNQYLGEAKFLRALTYFNLVRWFKYIPLVLHEPSSLNPSSINAPQASEDSVYAQIISDLKDAESLPSPSEYSAEDAGRATAGSAKALLAKVYLTRQQWQLAAEKAKEVIDSGWYGLFDNFHDNFDPAKKNGKESVFAVQFTGHSDKTVVHWMAQGEATYDVPGINGGEYDAYNTRSNLYSSYDANDQRKNVTFITSIVSPTDGKTYQLSAPTFNKYYDYTSVGDQSNSSVNIPVIRYSEVLLIYAEALNELNGRPTPEAYQAIDQVRARAGIPLLSSISPNETQNEFRESVFEERRKEFVFEYNRWFDLSRRGGEYFVEKLRAAGKTNVQPRDIHLPIPQRELDLNPNLKQNPDWK